MKKLRSGADVSPCNKKRFDYFRDVYYICVDFEIKNENNTQSAGYTATVNVYETLYQSHCGLADVFTTTTLW